MEHVEEAWVVRQQGGGTRVPLGPSPRLSAENSCQAGMLPGHTGRLGLSIWPQVVLQASGSPAVTYKALSSVSGQGNGKARGRDGKMPGLTLSKY